MMKKVGIFGTSLMENEKRVPIYPEHIEKLPKAILKNVLFEENYGIPFGHSNEELMEKGINFCSRKKLFDICDILILPKPTEQDFELMKNGQVHFGWPHCVQQKKITQYAIDKKLTFIAWEAMNLKATSGEKLMHVFYKNNELAGYSAVIHSLQLKGIDGLFGPRRKVVVLGWGSVSKGAVLALRARGFNNIHVYTRRETHLVADQNPDVYYHHFEVDKNGTVFTKEESNKIPIFEKLKDADIIVNGVLQNVNDPFMFVTSKETCELKPRTLIIDISCDEGMGFAFAKPTSFESPVFYVGDNICYYSVDHTPSYLWDAASREISRFLIPFLSEIIQGELTWFANPILKNAIEILDGKILNPDILSFQNRSDRYPYTFR